MKAITTRYAGPTDTKGSRIIAREPDGRNLSLPYPHELSIEKAHRKAAEALAYKLGWNGELCGGYIGGSRYAFVFCERVS